MQKIKIFKQIETEIKELENEVNNWITESHVNVVNIIGNIAPQTQGEVPSRGLSGSSFAPSDVLIIVLYETTGV